ncbi:MAG: nitrilase-related carbon-nitrogen hydrolase [Lentisphaeria bacterium]|nr:nitrilase-related carbon-nitrogen hydrolase [Lentisphaeria bacterium]
MDILRYSAAACQVDLPNPTDRSEIGGRVDRFIEMVRMAVEGYSAFLPVKLIVFPEYAHAAPVYPTAAELRQRLSVPVPNEHTERYSEIARELDVYIQTGTFIEQDPAWPWAVFNTTCLIGPTGLLTKYRKVNPWIPWEVHASPHDLEGYQDELFPVARTPIGNLGVAICYDWLFPEVLRQITANGAEVLIRVSAYMDPWGATPPMDWWTVVNRCRALENIAYVVAANQAASLSNYPPFSWPGGSMIVDFEGRIQAQADPGAGAKIVVAPVDVSALRHERKMRTAHHMPAHLRTEAYPVYNQTFFPPGQHTAEQNLDVEKTRRAIDTAKGELECEE